MKLIVKSKTLLLIALLLTAASAHGDDHIDLVKKGNVAFTNGKYREALEFYHSAETDLPESPELYYNMAGAHHRQGGYEEAVDNYTRSLNTTDINLESNACYNLGNTYFRMQDYENAIKSYESALNLYPEDMDAKYNLELARKMLKDQMQPQQQEQEQQQEQQQQEQQQEQQQDQDQQEQQQQQQQEQQSQEEQQQQQQAQPQEKEKEMSPEDAERILNALRDAEGDIQKKINRQSQTGGYTGHDW